ncbi:hypothetical protein TM239_20040 [Bradyrhizobium sp. TM239]|nr:hypothetical protein TM239_20040 [Bradyrhizobium sp. TM239]
MTRNTEREIGGALRDPGAWGRSGHCCRVRSAHPAIPLMRALALIDRSSALRLILLIERKRGEQPVGALNQFGVKSLCPDNCLARVVAREKAENGDGQGSRTASVGSHHLGDQQ